ncbi:tripartite tricarboxylate transporter substrate binding protein [Variovorax sp. J22R115]|uniref:Bug family tripartite tricarboxylate transporter substrate binding protein n=1 Tax=Variovorax sp. J22R115 TaxID=3053509 RepID=UPI0025763924|nr:tripartite tricarboxylate transporter substrate binding protein [Variovorax sp. J22R115]
MRWLAGLILLFSALIWLFPASGQALPFPSAPINLVVPLAPGDAADIAARTLGEEISRLLQTPVLSINRPGAGGAVGTHSVVQAKKDGYTILFAQNSALTFRAVLDPQSVTYDALRDLVPLGTASRTPTLLVVRSDSPHRSFAELIEYSKSRPGQVRIGHPGSGSVGDFCVQLINALTGAELVGIPYAGAAPGIVALHGEHIEGVVLALGALSAHIKSGAFRGLVASSRSPEFVDIPTMRELGYQEELFGIWFSFLAPAGIPEDARKALVRAIEQAVNAPAVTARLAPLGILQSYATPEQTTAEIRAEFKRVGDMARKTGLIR